MNSSSENSTHMVCQHIPSQVHQCEVGVGIDETASMSEEQPILLRMCSQAEFEWVENVFYHGEGVRIPVFKPKVGLFPMKKLTMRKEVWHIT